MKSNLEIVSAANELQSIVDVGIAKISPEASALLNVSPDTTDDDAYQKVETVLALMESVYRGAKLVTGEYFPKALKTFRITGSESRALVLTLKTAKSAELSVRRSISIDLSDSAFDDLALFFNEVMFYLFYIEQAQHNIAVLNQRLAEITDEDNLPIKVQFKVTDDTSALVSITDKEVVLKADLSGAIDITTTPLGVTFDDDYSISIFNMARTEYARQIRALTLAPAIFKLKNPLFRKIACLNTRKRVDKIIRMAYHRKFENTKNGEVGYYDKDGVFAIVENRDDTFVTVLSPFDVKTITRVNMTITL